MHNLKDIRKNLEHFKKKLNNRNADVKFIENKNLEKTDA